MRKEMEELKKIVDQAKRDSLLMRKTTKYSLLGIIFALTFILRYHVL
jgi:hypothetical protein